MVAPLAVNTVIVAVLIGIGVVIALGITNNYVAPVATLDYWENTPSTSCANAPSHSFQLLRNFWNAKTPCAFVGQVHGKDVYAAVSGDEQFPEVRLYLANNCQSTGWSFSTTFEGCHSASLPASPPPSPPPVQDSVKLRLH